MLTEQSDEFFEALGEPKPENPFDLLDAYRFRLCYQQLGPGSVLDVGTYLGDFLKLAREDGRELFGTEINMARVNLVNSIMGPDIVRLDFRNGHLKLFATDSVDNVVCMETLEHVADDRNAISELCRVARNMVVITVPYRETVPQVLCTHCGQFTPHYGHQHSYDQGSFTDLAPQGWQVAKEYSFAKKNTRMISRVLPESRTTIPVLKLIDSMLPTPGRWLLVKLIPEKRGY
ncbi:methyltransferase domain-containing protein [bacterium]|nr:methyltransferase domain-containing protein [bacterium]